MFAALIGIPLGIWIAKGFITGAHKRRARSAFTGLAVFLRLMGLVVIAAILVNALGLRYLTAAAVLAVLGGMRARHVTGRVTA